MEDTVLKRLRDYFLHPDRAWLYVQDITRATVEFADTPNALTEDADFSYFTDWYTFDFEFRPGRSLIAYAIAENPMGFSDGDITALRDMEAHNRYDFFDVIEKRKGMYTMVSIRDGETFLVEAHEKQGVVVGDALVGRIAQVGKKWQLISNAVLSMDSPSREDRERMRDNFPLVNARVIFREIILADRPSVAVERFGNSGEALVSGYAPGGAHVDDGCAICRAVAKAKKEGREPTRDELMRAFEEANAEQKRGGSPGLSQ